MVLRGYFALLVLLILVGMGAGCAREFDPYWRVDKLRLMAIKAEPAVAKQGEPVELSALTFVPGGKEIRYRWSWCPVRTSAQDGYECALSEEDLGPFAGQFGLELGEEQTATFINPMSAEQVKEFCEAIVSAILEHVDDPELARHIPVSDCDEGYEISIRLDIESGDEQITASRRLILHGGTEEINENPRFEAFEIRPEDPKDLRELIEKAGWELAADTEHEEQWIPIPEEERLKVLPEMEFEIRALVDPESLQTFTVGPPLGQPSQGPKTKEEALVFQYFVTTGTVFGSRGLYAPGANTLADAAEAQLHYGNERLEEGCLEPVDEGCQVRIWAVARDGRTGVDWIERSLVVVK